MTHSRWRRARALTVAGLSGLMMAACGSSPLHEPGAPGTPQPEPPVTLPTLQTDQVIVAHRGASGHAPEHTFAAYDLALAQGAEYIEQDVLPTADGVLVVIHDDTLDRTARGPAENCTGNVSDKTLEQLRSCDFGSWFNEAYPDRAREDYVGLPIPTLEEVFQRYGNAPTVKYYIEIKPNTQLGGSVEQTLLDLIKAYGLYEGAINNRQVLVQSFIPSSLINMRALDAELPLIQLYAVGATASVALASTYAFGIGPNAAEVTPALVELTHALGLAIHPYTINSEADLAAMAALCVDGLFTNFPDRYRQVLASSDYDCPPPIR